MNYKALRLQRMVDNAEVPYRLVSAPIRKEGDNWLCRVIQLPADSPAVGLDMERFLDMGISKALSRKLESLGNKSYFARAVLQAAVSDY